MEGPSLQAQAGVRLFVVTAKQLRKMHAKSKPNPIKHFFHSITSCVKRPIHRPRNSLQATADNANNLANKQTQRTDSVHQADSSSASAQAETSSQNAQHQADITLPPLDPRSNTWLPMSGAYPMLPSPGAKTYPMASTHTLNRGSRGGVLAANRVGSVRIRSTIELDAPSYRYYREHRSANSWRSGLRQRDRHSAMFTQDDIDRAFWAFMPQDGTLAMWQRLESTVFEEDEDDDDDDDDDSFDWTRGDEGGLGGGDWDSDASSAYHKAFGSEESSSAYSRESGWSRSEAEGLLATDVVADQNRASAESVLLMARTTSAGACRAWWV